MRKIQKHAFEPVSLLTVENGILEVAIIPAQNQPDWIVPKNLILAIESYNERIWGYLWENQEVSVYHLIDKQTTPDTLVILEGNTEVHRVALQTSGQIDYKSVKISDVKDAPLPEEIQQKMLQNIPSLASADGDGHQLDFMYQTVSLNGQLYIVPELDLIAHRLVDLDS